jgi:transcriptional regulator with XRE-family HTH domain
MELVATDRVAAVVGSRLRNRRRAMLLSVEAVASQTKLAAATLTKAEVGEERLAPKAIIALAKVFGVAPSYFFEGLDKESAY